MSQYVFYDSEEEYLAHSLKGLERKFHKYIYRIKTGNKYRYFYSKSELDNYLKKIKSKLFGNKDKYKEEADSEQKETQQKTDETKTEEDEKARQAYVQSQRDAAMAKRTVEENRKQWEKDEEFVNSLKGKIFTFGDRSLADASKKQYEKSLEGYERSQSYADFVKDAYKATNEGRKAYQESEQKAEKLRKQHEQIDKQRDKDYERIKKKTEEVEKVYQSSGPTTQRKIDAAIDSFDWSPMSRAYSKTAVQNWNERVSEAENILDTIIDLYK